MGCGGIVVDLLISLYYRATIFFASDHAKSDSMLGSRDIVGVIALILFLCWISAAAIPCPVFYALLDRYHGDCGL